MGTNLPSKIGDFVAWADTHAAQWQDQQANIGISVAQVTAFKNLVGTLDSTFAAANAARQDSKDATMAQNTALAACRANASALITLIKGFAEATNNDNVYSLAGISANDPPGTAPAPTAPYNIQATLDSLGNLNLTWKASQPQGTSGVVYEIVRAFNGSGNFEHVDTVGGKAWTDDSVPSGTTTVSYVLTAKRGRDSSPPAATFTVRFGHAPGGGLTLTQAA